VVRVQTAILRRKSGQKANRATAHQEAGGIKT
jgi:hypothetical protein